MFGVLDCSAEATPALAAETHAWSWAEVGPLVEEADPLVEFEVVELLHPDMAIARIPSGTPIV